MTPAVLHLLEGLDRGGIETLELDLARTAPSANLDLTFLATRTGTLFPEFAALGPRFLPARRRFPLDPFLVQRLHAWIRERRFEVLHAHQAVTGLHAWCASRGTRAACCLTIHGFRRSARRDARALSFLLPRMDRRIVVGAGFLERLRQQLPAARGLSFEILQNGVDPARLEVPAHDLRAELGLSPETVLLGMVGNFQPGKDQATICRALPEVFTQSPAAHFIFIGAPSRPELQAECRRLCAGAGIEARVHFLGARADVPALLPSLDLFVFASLEDSFGLAPIEAMLRGVPCAVSDIPSLREVTGDGAAALLFQAGDAAALASSIRSLIADLPERRRLAETGRAWARERYGIQTHARNLARLYDSLRRPESDRRVC